MAIQTVIIASLALATGLVLGRAFNERRRGGSVSEAGTDPDRLAAAKGQAATLALFDVDGLASVNRTNNFDTGDRLLNAVADVLFRGLPSGAALERLESGRFLIWSPDPDLDDTSCLAETLRQLACRAHVDSAEGKVARTLTAGVVATSPDESRARAILRADAAVSTAKHAGGDRTYTLRTQAMPTLIPTREVIEEAIATRALEYHVQPILQLSDRKAVGIENLLRWNRPDGTVSGPAGFLDTLNRLPEAGVDLLPQIATEAASPFVTGPDPLYATFNITGAVLDGEGSAACVWLSHLLDTLPNDQLVLELVETAIIMAPDRARDLLGRLRDRGLRIALDDFGTGLSNLERLRSYPVDILKIDRAFVGGLGTTGREEAILEAMVSLARGMDLDLITEGIETEEQARSVADIGVKFGQGYHLGRPAAAADWARRMARRP